MLHPARALLTPTWLFALVVLAVNDHALKQAAPGVWTGKLSDLAGLVVAPALLACVLAVRGRRGVLACHVAVGLVFAAINLSRAAADLWSGLMGAIGAPWAIVVDPTDLLALPALALSWYALVPAMQRPLSRPARRILAGAVSVVGLLVCTATSRPHPHAGPPPLDEGAIVVAMAPRVEGRLELRCDDGFRVDVAMTGSSYVRVPKPPPDAECKLQLLGAQGTFGPVTADMRMVDCTLTGEGLVCARKL